MSARTAEQPKLKIGVNVGDSSTPAHLEYHTKYGGQSVTGCACFTGREK